jgi:hypothetical protein
MLSFIYQLLIIVAVFVALPFQRNWQDRKDLLFAVVGSAILIDGLLIALSYAVVKNKLPILGFLDFLLLWLPLLIPVGVWCLVGKRIRNRQNDNH